MNLHTSLTMLICLSIYIYKINVTTNRLKIALKLKISN